MYLFLCQRICSQLCSLLIKKIGSEHLTLPVQQRVKMAWKRLQRCCGFVPTQLGGRMPLKCQVWCVPASPSRGLTGAVPASVLNNGAPFQRDVESNCCLSPYWYSCRSRLFFYLCNNVDRVESHSLGEGGGALCRCCGVLLFVSPGTQPLHIHVHRDRKGGGKISAAH